ncbi:hypothetical protein EON65_33660 [archaeon]|nr:MAG: hypothetical protein EON65_33660 [archaeon]
MESLEWMREYELLKQVINKPKDPYELKKANISQRRHNIGHQEVCKGVYGGVNHSIFCVILI